MRASTACGGDDDGAETGAAAHLHDDAIAAAQRHASRRRTRATWPAVRNCTPTTATVGGCGSARSASGWSIDVTRAPAAAPAPRSAACGWGCASAGCCSASADDSPRRAARRDRARRIAGGDRRDARRRGTGRGGRRAAPPFPASCCRGPCSWRGPNHIEPASRSASKRSHLAAGRSSPPDGAQRQGPARAAVGAPASARGLVGGEPGPGQHSAHLVIGERLEERRAGSASARSAAARRGWRVTRMSSAWPGGSSSVFSSAFWAAMRQPVGVVDDRHLARRGDRVQLRRSASARAPARCRSPSCASLLPPSGPAR